MKILTKMMIASSLILASFFPLASMAEVKIGILDMRVVSSSPQAKAAIEKLKKEFKPKEDKMLAIGNALKEKTEKFQRDAAIMKEAEKSKLEKEITTAQQELQRLQNEYRETANVRQQEEMKKIYDKISKAVEEVAKKGKYDLILTNDAVPYADPKLYITDDVTKLMEKS